MTATDLTPPEHCHSVAVEEAARWLTAHRAGLTRPIIPALRDRFGLTITEAVEASSLAAKIEHREGTQCAS